MKTNVRAKLALLTALALALSLGLVGCSDESLTTPADPAPQATLDEQWQTQVDALRAEIGDAAMAEMAPQFEQARADLGDLARKDGARLFLAYATTNFDQTYVYHDGWATVMGHYTGLHTVAPDSIDFSTDPPTPYTTVTHTDDDGDQLVHISSATFVFGEDGTSFEFYGGTDWAGGTGRYANATGFHWTYGTGSVVTRTGRYIYWGWIDLGDDD